MKHLTDTLREALERAQNGLKWYRDTYPDADSQADDEMNAEIEEALTALAELEQVVGNQEPVAWMANFTNRYGNPDVYVTTHKHLAVENDANGAPRPLVFGHLGTADECGNEWIALQDAIERKDALLKQALDAVENVNTTMPFLVAHELRQAITKELAK